MGCCYTNLFVEEQEKRETTPAITALTLAFVN